MQEFLSYDPSLTTPDLLACKVMIIKPTQGQKIINKLSEDFPLSRFNLGHIKRIQKHSCEGKLEIVLGPVTYEFGDIQEEAQACENCEQRIIEKDIPKLVPFTMEQGKSWSKIWPVVFKKSDSQAYQHTSEELKVLDELFDQHIDTDNALIYDPNTGKVVIDRKGDGLLDHPVMKVIEKFSPDGDQYYCTSLWCLTFDEPCVMCAMAMVHSRFERVYFRKPNLRTGAYSYWDLHLKPLNHMYRVFQKLS